VKNVINKAISLSVKKTWHKSN